MMRRLAGCDEEIVEGGRRLARSRDRDGDKRVVGEARARVGGCGRRLVEGCRDNGEVAASEGLEKRSESVMTASEKKRPGRLWSKLGGACRDGQRR